MSKAALYLYFERGFDPTVLEVRVFCRIVHLCSLKDKEARSAESNSARIAGRRFAREGLCVYEGGTVMKDGIKRLPLPPTFLLRAIECVEDIVHRGARSLWCTQ